MAPKKELDVIEKEVVKHKCKEAIIKMEDLGKKNPKNRGRLEIINRAPDPFLYATQLYTFISERNKLTRTFMLRNLTYMKHRMPRNNRCRQTFSVDDMLEKAVQKNTPCSKNLTLTFWGFYDTTLPTGENTTARVETFIVKRTRNRRSGPLPEVKAQVGTVEVPINPELNDPRSAPILSIAPESTNTTNSAEKTRWLLLRVLTDNGPPFEVRLNVFNRKGQCVLKEGEYDSTGSRGDVMWVKVPDVKCDPLKPKISFKLEWTSDPKSGWVPRPTPKAPSRALKPVRGNVRPSKMAKPAPKDKEYTISYDFQFHKEHLDAPSSHAYECPFCKLNCGKPYSLFKHLRTSHDRFNFTFDMKDNHIRIDVSLNPEADVSHEGNPYEFVRPIRDVVMRRTPYTEVHVYKPRRHKPSLAEFLNPEDVVDFEVQRPLTHGHNRLYYHSTNTMPIHINELNYDSEGERDPVWLQEKTKMLIDEFTDVNEGEKEIIKMWNLHYLKHGFVGDCQVFRALQMFVEEHGFQIIRKNIIRNFQLHMANLFDFGVINPIQFYDIMKMLREKMRQDPEGCRMFGAAWVASRNSWLASGGEGGPRDKASTSQVEDVDENGDADADLKQKHTSTFISGDGTRRRKMAGAAGRKGRPPNSTKSTNGDDTDDEKVLSARRRSISDEPMKKSATDSLSAANRALRKRKLSLQDRASSSEGAAKRSRRSDSDPQKRKSAAQSSEASGSKSTLRKSCNPETQC